MMNCGYDPAPDGQYDLPPIAPQMWHAYHIAGEQLAMAIIAALLFRWRTGKGQSLSCAIHEAVAKCTEVDLMSLGHVGEQMPALGADEGVMLWLGSCVYAATA
jgi:crotonobetainyl-CoA:carnitine CoA-transferase CaiB-like acyl-CoA transferase